MGAAEKAARLRTMIKFREDQVEKDFHTLMEQCRYMPTDQAVVRVTEDRCHKLMTVLMAAALPYKPAPKDTKRLSKTA